MTTEECSRISHVIVYSSSTGADSRYAMKTKVGAQCKFREMCEGLPGFCMFIPYVLIASTVFMVIYFMLTSKL